MDMGCLWGLMKVLHLIVVVDLQSCEHTKKTFKGVNCMVCKLYLSEAVT